MQQYWYVTIDDDIMKVIIFLCSLLFGALFVVRIEAV